jgi:hypothetical protein
VRWHRASFRPLWRWTSRRRAGRPATLQAVDLFVVPTIGFRLLYGLAIPNLERLLDQAPRYLICDRDRSYGAVVTRRLQAMGVRDRPIAPRSPWQNGHVERLIGSIRRECLDHVVVFGEAHLRRMLTAYAAYYDGLCRVL